MIPYLTPPPDIFSMSETYYIETSVWVPQNIVREEDGIKTVESKFVNPKIKKVSFDMPFDNSIEVDEEQSKSLESLEGVHSNSLTYSFEDTF
tara:strand:- start:629 stop:904 length:276 start_codon:yes stop_codon:yes gene_type:complete